MSPVDWADRPFKLIPVPKYTPERDHSCVHCAPEMANAHNVLIRGFNSLVQQAPLIPEHNTAGYVEADVKDLLFYVRAWCKTVNHHHDTEEVCLFPTIEKWSGQSGILAGELKQHEQFHGGMERLLAYASGTSPEQYAWKDLEEIINSFGETLVTHLRSEVESFLSFTHLDSSGLWDCWLQGEKYAAKTGNLGMLYDVFPCVLGTADKTFPGSFEFPPLPWIMPYLIKYWFAAGNGAWRFNPCDFWGQPRPLHFKRDGESRGVFLTSMLEQSMAFN